MILPALMQGSDFGAFQRRPFPLINKPLTDLILFYLTSFMVAVSFSSPSSSRSGSPLARPRCRTRRGPTARRRWTTSSWTCFSAFFFFFFSLRCTRFVFFSTKILVDFLWLPNDGKINIIKLVRNRVAYGKRDYFRRFFNNKVIQELYYKNSLKWENNLVICNCGR